MGRCRLTQKRRNPVAGTPDAQRAGARTILASVIVILIALAGAQGVALVYSSGAIAQPQPTGTAPSGPVIKLLNPHPGYDPVTVSPQEPADPPKISDKFDGVDNAYHIVAWTDQIPANSVVEATWTPNDENAITAGTLLPVPGSTDTWELFWEIPASVTEGGGVMRVDLFRQTGGGLDSIADDEVEADLFHEGTYPGGDEEPAEDTVELTWPAQDGQLGFYKGRGGAWRAIVDGVASGPFLTTVTTPGGSSTTLTGGTQRIWVFFTTSQPGEAPEFTQCATIRTDNVTRNADNTVPWRATCLLAGKTLPSEITALVAVAGERDQPSRSGTTGTAEQTQESADVHRIAGFEQDPRQMKIVWDPREPATQTASWPTGERRVANSDCLEIIAYARDQMDRPVIGANVDFHVQGPNDLVGFGDDAQDDTGSNGSSNEKPPEKGHNQEYGWDCDSPGNLWTDSPISTADRYGDHNIPAGGDDIKHMETTAGTGLSAGGPLPQPGGFRIDVFSPDPGFAEVIAWVDDEPLAAGEPLRPLDDDLIESGEPSSTLRTQWFPGPMRVELDPPSGGAAVGTCRRYTARVRAGTAAVPNINVDVHASGPDDQLDFCDPGDGSLRRAPEAGDHQQEDAAEGSHSGAPPQLQHTQGETSAEGNFVFGLISPTSGDTTITVWVDGEPDADNDIFNSGELTVTGSNTWASNAGEARVRFVNPSGYGGSGDNVSTQQDGDNNFHLVARVDAAEVIPGVEFLIAPGTGTSVGTFTKIGDASRVGESDTYEMMWSVPQTDGSYTLRAQIAGTERRDDRAITINRESRGTVPTPPPPTQDAPAFETADLAQPGVSSNAPFSQGETVMTGTASAGAEAVDFYYTKTGAAQVRDSAAWTLCGTVTFTGSSTQPRPFSGKCKLTGTDVAASVTGLAVVAADCDANLGCTASRVRESGDAHRVFGYDANPVVLIEPAEDAAPPGDCQRYEFSVEDQNGLPIASANIDVHLSGPNQNVAFCTVQGNTPRRAPDQGAHGLGGIDHGTHPEEGGTKHTEGEVNADGRMILGIVSNADGDSQLTAWADIADNDAQDGDEPIDTALMHWGDTGGRGGPVCTETGTADDDVLFGTKNDDVICGGGGDDVIRGLGGDDKLIGNGGKDILRGGKGNDVLQGGGANDRLRGDAGNDRLRGNKGNDVLVGGAGNDNMNGAGGKDVLKGNRGRDVLSGRSQNDRLNGGASNDRLNGGSGRDVCRGGPGRNTKRGCER